MKGPPNGHAEYCEYKQRVQRKKHSAKMYRNDFSRGTLAFIAILMASVVQNTGVSGLGGNMFGSLIPPGVNQTQVMQLIPTITGVLAQCGGPTALIDALNFATENKDFTNSAMQVIFAAREKIHDKKSKTSEKNNPLIEGMLQILTSKNMTKLIKSEGFNKLSASLNLTCVVNYPDVSKKLKSTATKILNETKDVKMSLDIVSGVIQAGLLYDLGDTITPAFVDCGGTLKLLTQFMQALAYWIRGNQEDTREKPLSSNPNLNKYREMTPSELNKQLQCTKTYNF